MNLSFTNTHDPIAAQYVIDEAQRDQDRREFITSFITEYSGNPQYQYIDTALRYYGNQNDIVDKVRTVIGRTQDNKPCLMVSSTLSNNRISHNFLKKLTRQKIGYMIGKPFSVVSDKEDDEVTDALIQQLKDYFGKDFYKILKNVARDSIVAGLGWLMVYYNREGNLKFKRCDPKEILPLWEDSDHTVLTGVVRKYLVEYYEGGKKTTVTYIDYYEGEYVYHYTFDKSGMMTPRTDNGEQAVSRHFTLVDAQGQEIPTSWARLPFIPFKYDADEQSLLMRIKDLVDEYDKRTSAIADTIDDIPNSQLMIKNYDGNTPEEFIHNKNQYRVLFVQGDGDAKSLETPLDIDQQEIHLERVRQDIYEFGQGVNTADKDIRDTSGVALRFMYADLDMDCIDWGTELEWSIMSLIWFIQQDIKAKTNKDFTDTHYSILFSNDVIINETETIQNALISKGVISDETIIEHHPWTKDVEKEMADRYASTEEILSLEAEYGEPVAGAGGTTTSATL